MESSAVRHSVRKMFSHHLSSSLAYSIQCIDPNLDDARDEGEARLIPLRAVLRLVAKQLRRAELVDMDSDQSFGSMLSFNCSNAATGQTILCSLLNQHSTAKPKICLVSAQSRLLTPLEADELDEKVRLTCVPISNSDDVALPVESTAAPSRVLVTFPEALCGGVREAKMDIARVAPDSVAITTLSASGIRKFIKAVELAPIVLDKLFSRSNAALTRGSLSIPRHKYELPSFLKLALVSFFEQRLRLQVLCTASTAAPSTRPVSIDRVRMVRLDKTKKSWLSVNATLHPSSSSCICSAHGLRNPLKGRVAVRVETCGRALERFGNNFRCPCHENAVDDKGSARFSEEGFCTEATTITATCWHQDQNKSFKRGVCIDEFRLSDADRKEIAVILITMLEFESRTASMYSNGFLEAGFDDRVTEIVERLNKKFDKKMQLVQVLQMSEQDPDELNPKEMLRRDMTAVDLLRKGGVRRHRHKKGERRGTPYLRREKYYDDTPPLTDYESKLVSTHGHLFRKCV